MRPEDDDTKASGNFSDVSILYVEDDEIVREILCSFIIRKYPAVPVYSAGTAEDGIELFNKHHQSIVITDINLPGADGIKMVRSIRKLDPDTVIIFITGCSDIERITEFEGAASCHYLCKPLDYNDLFALFDCYMHIAVRSEKIKAISP
jgi:YesN/AraC family two-component response regulator